MLFCFPCPNVLPVFSQCHPLVCESFSLNTLSIPPPWSLLQQKNNKTTEWNDSPNTGFHQGGRQEWTLNEWKRLQSYIVDGEEGETCYEIMCSEWIISRAASKGGDGGGKVWGRQKGVVMMRRRRKRKKEATPLLHVRMCISVVFPHLCVLCWFMLCVFCRCVLHSITFIFQVAFVCTTPGSNCLHKHYRTACFIPHRCRRIVVFHSDEHKMHQSETN